MREKPLQAGLRDRQTRNPCGVGRVPENEEYPPGL